MKNKLPKQYKNNILKRRSNRIKELFFRKKKYETSNEINVSINEKNDFLEVLKADLDKKNTDYEKKKLMKKIAKNPELLERFSNDRLEKILEYYLLENEKLIERLKKSKHNKKN